MESNVVIPTEDEKNWATIAHAGPVIAVFVSGGTLGWLVPLFIYLTKGDQSPYARRHSVESLNFQISLWIFMSAYAVLSALLICAFGIGLLMLMALPVIYVVPTLIFGIQASLASSRGDAYQYPYTVRLVR